MLADNNFKFDGSGRGSQLEGQDGPGSLTWIFEMTRANFFFFLSLLLSEKNLQQKGHDGPVSLH